MNQQAKTSLTDALMGLALVLALCVPSISDASPGKGKGPFSKRALEVIDSRGNDKVNLIVTYRSKADAADAAAAKSQGASIRRNLGIINGHAISVPASAAAKLIEHNPNIAHVSVDEQLTSAYYTVGSSSVADSFTSVPTPVMHAYPGLATLSYTGEGIRVAVVDTGMKSHPDAKAIARVSLVKGQKEDDNHGHGNHIAGTIAGSGSHSDGPYRGVAPNAEIVAVRALDDTGQGLASDVIASFDWVVQAAVQHGIRVVNLSLGHPVYEPAATDPLVQAVEALWDAGIVVVASAGNAGRDGYGTITSPGNAPSIITVGSITHWGDTDTSNDIVSTYSSRGPTRGDLIMKPDLLAPGNRLISIRTKSGYLPSNYPERLIAAPGKATEEYYQLSGTSMAAAVVSGAVALMLEKDPSLNPATVKARLMRSADKTQFPDAFATGAGVLDIEAALADTGVVADAPSPRVKRIEEVGMLGFEDTATLWGGAEWALGYLWADDNTVADMQMIDD